MRCPSEITRHAERRKADALARRRVYRIAELDHLHSGRPAHFQVAEMTGEAALPANLLQRLK